MSISHSQDSHSAGDSPFLAHSSLLQRPKSASAAALQNLMTISKPAPLVTEIDDETALIAPLTNHRRPTTASHKRSVRRTLTASSRSSTFHHDNTQTPVTHGEETPTLISNQTGSTDKLFTSSSLPSSNLPTTTNSSNQIPSGPIRSESRLKPLRTLTLDVNNLSIKMMEILTFLRLFFTLQIIISPEASFKRFWDYMIILMVLYNSFLIPWYIAFDPELSNILSSYDTITTVSMALDIFVTLRTAFVDFTGNLCYDGILIAKRYWKRGLLLDVLGTFPFDIFSSLAPTNNLTLLACFKVLGILRFTRLMYNDRLDAWNNPTSRICKLMFGFFYMAHLFGSHYFFL